MSSEKANEILLACWNDDLVTTLLKPINFRQLFQVRMLPSNLPLQYAEGGTALEGSSKL